VGIVTDLAVARYDRRAEQPCRGDDQLVGRVSMKDPGNSVLSTQAVMPLLSRDGFACRP